MKVKCKICGRMFERVNKPNQGRNLGVSTRGFNALTCSKPCARKYTRYTSYQRKELKNG